MSPAQRALALLIADPRLGGMLVRGDSGALLAELPAVAPTRRIPVGVEAERLTGALDVATTLATGRPVYEPGLIAEAGGGFLIVPMAERLTPDIVGLLAAALDTQSVRVILLDSGSADEAVPPALVDRVAFIVDTEQSGDAAQQSMPGDMGDPTAIVEVAHALGVASLRAEAFAWRVAQATGDVSVAVELVLAPRATRWPAPSPPAQSPPTSAPDGGAAMADVVLDAVSAVLPADAIAAIIARNLRARAAGRGGGARSRARARGRPAGHRAGMPRGGARLALIATLRAAAPWQRLRGGDGRIRIRKADLRIRRVKPRAAVTTIFAVDASGSAAAARMAEAKGAVELLLSRAYAERAQVALVAFRGDGADVLLPPTRSLTRARRLLADLPGGGATPLAAGLSAARTLALAERGRDRAPRIIVLTDGRANIPLATAQHDAERAAAAIARDGLAATVIDISARPRAEGRALAAAMRARYVALPRADAHAMSAALA